MYDSQSTDSEHRFGVTIHPANPSKHVRVRNHYSAEVLTPSCSLEGWILPVAGCEIHGIRAIVCDQPIVAKRKQLRPDIHKLYPYRMDALHSGFKIALRLQPGASNVVLQFKDAGKKWHDFCHCRLRLPYSWRLRQLWSKHLPQSDYERWLVRHEALTTKGIAAMRAAQCLFPRKPLISLLMPTYNTPERWLRRVISTVRQQIYTEWELCVADDNSSRPEVHRVLRKAARTDPRIKVTFRESNGHICAASNSALEMCTGEFTALLDHDDELSQDALFRVVESLTKHPDTDLLFSDEDKIDEHGVRFFPYFKPGWNYELFLHENCFSHLGVFRTSLLRAIGGFRPGMEGSQDWDLTFRAIERISKDRIRHIPHCLYHWRTLETSTASSVKAKPYAPTAGMKAVEDHLARLERKVKIEPTSNGLWHIVWPLPSPPPLASIIIPTKDRIDLLRVALDSLFGKTDYESYEVIIVDHSSEKAGTQDYFQTLLAERKQVKIVREEGAFNWSRLNNAGASSASGEVLVFLNNDVEITKEGWLRELVSQAWREDVGAVGACLLFPDGNIQHAGVVLGITGVAGHVFRGGSLRDGHTSIAGSASRPREVTAVTGACMAVRATLFKDVGGFDADNLPVNYNDIDFCLRLRARGLRNIYTPFACLVHHESVSRAALERQSARKEAATEEARIVLSRWPQEFAQDAFFNPNLDKNEEWPSFESATPAGEPVDGAPWE